MIYIRSEGSNLILIYYIWLIHCLTVIFEKESGSKDQNDENLNIRTFLCTSFLILFHHVLIQFSLLRRNVLFQRAWWCDYEISLSQLRLVRTQAIKSHYNTMTISFLFLFILFCFSWWCFAICNLITFSNNYYIC